MTLAFTIGVAKSLHKSCKGFAGFLKRQFNDKKRIEKEGSNQS